MARGKLALVREFGRFLGARKKWWIIPVAVTLVLLGLLMVMTQGSAVAPFIYTVF